MRSLLEKVFSHGQKRAQGVCNAELSARRAQEIFFPPNFFPRKTRVELSAARKFFFLPHTHAHTQYRDDDVDVFPRRPVHEEEGHGGREDGMEDLPPKRIQHHHQANHSAQVVSRPDRRRLGRALRTAPREWRANSRVPWHPSAHERPLLPHNNNAHAPRPAPATGRARARERARTTRAQPPSLPPGRTKLGRGWGRARGPEA